MMQSYTVEVRRSGRWWAIDVPDLKGVHTQTRRLSEVDEMARDAIGGALEISPRSIRINIRPVLDARLSRRVREARRARVLALEAQIESAEKTSAALKALRNGGLALRDAGELLGISHQRAAQLHAEDPRRARPERHKAIAELRGEYDFGDDHIPLRNLMSKI
jgi:Uncharacterised protein family (UPF0150).